jgi:hypothetical protein
MTNEEKVLDKINNNRWFGKSPLYFRTFTDIENADLHSINDITERVYKIFTISKYSATLDSRGRYQCCGGANRSTGDVWRIYKYYFGDIDIFTIMRALYKLVSDSRLGTFRCSTVRKRVFWLINGTYTCRNFDDPAEFGVPLRDWKDIGLSNDQTTQVS